MLPVVSSGTPLSLAVSSSHNLTACDYLVKPFRNPLFLITQIVQVCINFIIAGSVFSAIVLSGGVYLISLALYWIRCSSSPKSTQILPRQTIIHRVNASPPISSVSRSATPRSSHHANDESGSSELSMHPVSLVSPTTAGFYSPVPGTPTVYSPPSSRTVAVAAKSVFQQRQSSPPNTLSPHVDGSSSMPPQKGITAEESASSSRPHPAPPNVLTPSSVTTDGTRIGGRRATANTGIISSALDNIENLISFMPRRLNRFLQLPLLVREIRKMIHVHRRETHLGEQKHLKFEEQRVVFIHRPAVLPC